MWIQPDLHVSDTESRNTSSMLSCPTCVGSHFPLLRPGEVDRALTAAWPTTRSLDPLPVLAYSGDDGHRKEGSPLGNGVSSPKKPPWTQGPMASAFPSQWPFGEPDVLAQLQESLEELISIKAESQFGELILPAEKRRWGRAPGPPRSLPASLGPLEEAPFGDALGEGRSAPATLTSGSERSRGQLNLHPL